MNKSNQEIDDNTSLPDLSLLSPVESPDEQQDVVGPISKDGDDPPAEASRPTTRMETMMKNW